MSTKNFTATYLVDQSPKEVFDAINNIYGWWNEEVKGNAQKLDDEFEVSFWDKHYTKQKLIEVIPNKKVVWLVTDCKLTFITKETEWTGTTISFEIVKQGDKTQINFTHVGLVPEFECFKSCSGGWKHYLNSLESLITTGKGEPYKEELDSIITA